MKKKVSRKEMKKARKRRRNKAIIGTTAVTAVAAGAAMAAAYQVAFGRTKIGYNMSLGTRSEDFNEARAYGAQKLSDMPCEEYEIKSARRKATRTARKTN